MIYFVLKKKITDSCSDNSMLANFSIMKYTGYISLLIGVFGVYSIADWSNQAKSVSIEAQKFNGLINIEAIPIIPYELLIMSQVLGILFGIISIRKKLNKKISYTGIVVCLLNLGFLLWIR